jgi:peptidoglycan/xylan/chitin deacetylase (PgdA/CDA1 family)
MRPVLKCVLVGLMMAAPSGAARAGVACEGGEQALGVERIVEVDTSSGPRFGHQQYQDQVFLADGEVVLTFDDGPLRPYTRPVLKALDAECTKATFFMVGQMALADPEMAREVARRGHTIGSHTWSHKNLKRLTPLKARGEIELGLSAVSHALGTPPAPFFRFPYLSDPLSMVGYLQSRQIGIFSIEVDSTDYRTRDPATVQRTVMNQLAIHHKGIILFHDIQPSTARALPGILALLKAHGYRVVHLVPKAQATTLPDFDAMAQQEAQRRRVAAVAQPLAPRSLTWPMSASPRTDTPAPAPGQLPPGWLPPGWQPPGTTAPQSPRPWVPDPEDEDWRTHVFRR